MRRRHADRIRAIGLGALALLLGAADQPSSPTAAPAAAQPSAPDKLVILFDSGSGKLGGAADATLDRAAHLYRVGKPIVMIVTGSTDATGSPSGNLLLSERRARVVIDGLVARGIPVAKLQLLAAGATQPAVEASADTPVPDDRRAEITWR